MRSLFTDPLFSLQSPSGSQGIYWPPAQGDSGGGFFFLALRARSRALASLAVVFAKNVRPQVAQARNRSLGERRHCRVTLYKMCVTSLLYCPWADLWPFYELYCKRFSLYIKVHTHVAQARQTSAKYKDVYGEKTYRFRNLRKWKDFNKKQLTLHKMCVTSLLCGQRADLWLGCTVLDCFLSI